ncbi:tetratricopeptide repeat protein [Carboxylicivirga marina]|uniref:Tetratricopeptide repeat protein n=2 Tax=Carboxylicivirga marina TaxID=2800988 RepID=A0ABS1HFU1_9BACT|nr:tetratricopeptide repeat protein [Carboxylicivirga marina]MBK3516531.1 tetratricopeptide repeat protein [Carboxylicivirga marina]
MVKYEKDINKAFGIDIFNDSNTEAGRELGVKIGKLLATDCSTFLEYITKQNDGQVNKAENLYDKAEALSQKGQYNQAIELYNQAILINPAYPKYYNSRGIAYYRLQNYYRAIGDFYLSTDLDSTNHLPYYNIAYSLYHLGDYKTSLQMVEKTIETNHYYCVAHNLKGLLLDDDNLEEALSCYRKAFNCDTTNLVHSFNVGYALYRQYNYTEAIGFLLKYYEENHENQDLLSYIGVCYNNLGEYNKALSFHDKVINMTNSKQWIPFYNRGMVYYDSGDYVAALKDFKQARSIDSSDLDIDIYIIRTLIKAGQYNDAIQVANKCIELHDDVAGFYDVRAQAYKELNKFQLAINDYYTSLDLYPNDCEVHFYIGQLYDLLNQKNKAHLAYQKAKEMGCDQPELNSL